MEKCLEMSGRYQSNVIIIKKLRLCDWSGIEKYQKIYETKFINTECMESGPNLLALGRFISMDVCVSDVNILTFWPYKLTLDMTD